jgi:hypothetical protein
LAHLHPLWLSFFWSTSTNLRMVVPLQLNGVQSLLSTSLNLGSILSTSNNFHFIHLLPLPNLTAHFTYGAGAPFHHLVHLPQIGFGTPAPFPLCSSGPTDMCAIISSENIPFPIHSQCLHAFLFHSYSFYHCMPLMPELFSQSHSRIPSSLDIHIP